MFKLGLTISWGVAAAICWTGACAASREAEQLMGNTNWMVACDADHDCGDELSCLWSVCTTPCSRGADCAGLDDATCASPQADLVAECAAPQQAICQPEENVLMQAADAASMGDMGPGCEPARETCNGFDDDCDLLIDENADAECAAAILNADAVCAGPAGGAMCVFVECDPGFRSCDGEPRNGCETAGSACPN